MLNAGDADATVEIREYFTDRTPLGPYILQVRTGRTHHLRLNDLRVPEPIPLGAD